jgi:serine protease SohB
MITAGEYKRTLTLFGENTDKGRDKFREDTRGYARVVQGFRQGAPAT